MYSYSFDKQKYIFKVDFFETMNIDDVKAYIDEFKTLTFLPENLKIIYDLRDADVSINPQEVKQIAELTLNITDEFKSVCSAFLVKTPFQAALTILFSQTNSQPKTSMKVFSTIEAAKNWLEQK